MARNAFLDFLNGYEKPIAEDGRSSLIGKRFFSRSYSGSVARKKNKSLFAITLSAGNKFSQIVAFTSTKAYGAGFLTFGLVTFILYFINDYLNLGGDSSLFPLVVGIAASLLAVPLLLSDKSMTGLLQGNRLTEFIIFEFFCIKRMHAAENQKGIPAAAIAVLGSLLGLLGYFVPLWAILVSVLALVYIYSTLLSPEFSFYSTLLLLPYISYIPYSDVVLSAITVLSVLSLIRKAVCGKRVLFFEQYDILILLMTVFILISGIFVKGTESFVSSVLMICTSFGYFISSNLITNRRLADGALASIVISSLPAAVYSIYQLVLAITSGRASEITGTGIASTFADTGKYALFLMVAILFSVALTKHSRGAKLAFFSFFTVLNSVALILTGEMFAVLALLLGIIVYFALKLSSLFIPIVLILWLIPYAILLVPESVVDAVIRYIPSLSTISEIKLLWKKSFEAFRENLFTGIGMGSDSFIVHMEQYGIGGFSDSKNTFLEIGLEAGVFALSAFIILILVRLRHRSAYYSYVKNSQIATISPFIAMATFALLSYGATEYIWFDMPSFYLFFCVFGIGSATLRVAKRDVDDRILYYEDTRAVDYSALDIEIR